MNSETEKKIKYWNDIENSDEGKYPLWFLTCDEGGCKSLRKKLGIKETTSSKHN